jgi:hypothetical protein
VVGAALIYAVGVVGRYLYILRFHHPRHFVSSDARDLTDLAQRMIASPARQTIFDTVWPPGASATFALLLARDPTAELVAVVQFVASCAIPLILAHAGWVAAGPAPAMLVLALASIHFGLVHYGGFFLSEQLFQLSIALALWAGVVALTREDRRQRALDGAAAEGAASDRRRALLARVVEGVPVGLCWGLAAGFRPNALPTAAAVGMGLAAFWLWRKRSASIWLLAGGAIGMLAIVAPLAVRCSRLLGHGFCAVSSNSAMNVALGQVDGAIGAYFVDPLHPELNRAWVPPALLQHAREGLIQIPYSMFDTHGIAHWLWERLRADPLRFAWRMGRNAFDLFRVGFWPDLFGPVPPRIAHGLGWAFVAVAIIPGVWGLMEAIRRSCRRSDPAAGPPSTPAFLALVVLAVVALAACSLGEPRYRFPFDGALLIMGAAGLFGLPFTGRAVRSRALAVVGTPALAAAVAIISVSAPGHRPLAETELRPSPSADVRPALMLATPVLPHTGWNAAGNYRFSCEPTCRELRLVEPARSHARVVEVCANESDRYRFTFYRDDKPIGHVDVPPSDNGGGLRTARIRVPDHEGYDAVGVLPLYGNGLYAVGYVRPLSRPRVIAGALVR